MHQTLLTVNRCSSSITDAKSPFFINVEVHLHTASRIDNFCLMEDSLKIVQIMLATCVTKNENTMQMV